MLLYQVLAYTIHAKIQKSHINTINIKSAPTWNEEFELPNESYSTSDIENYLNTYIKTQGKD